MTEEEIKALVAELFTAFKSEILAATTEANKGLAANFKRELTKVKTDFEAKVAEFNNAEKSDPESEDSTKETPDVKILKQEFANLQQQLADKEAENLRIQRDQEFANLVGTKNFSAPKLVQDALISRYGNKLEYQNGEWFVKEGDNYTKLSEEFKKWSDSDEGKGLMIFEGTPGSGVRTKGKTTDNNVVDPNKTTSDPGTALLQAFSTR